MCGARSAASLSIFLSAAKVIKRLRRHQLTSFLQQLFFLGRRAIVNLFLSLSLSYSLTLSLSLVAVDGASNPRIKHVINLSVAVARGKKIPRE
jgi:hypothetical protein